VPNQSLKKKDESYRLTELDAESSVEEATSGPAVTMRGCLVVIGVCANISRGLR